ncbi:MAG: thioredoxin domain-containing protein, partial [Verrucomicrobiota bacterium]
SAKPEVLALMFYSESCGSCKILDPKVKAVKENYLTKPILFATFDHSNPASINQAALLAEGLDVEKIYNAQQKASGFMLIIDAESNEILAKLNREMSEAEIKASLDQALES